MVELYIRIVEAAGSTPVCSTREMKKDTSRLIAGWLVALAAVAALVYLNQAFFWRFTGVGMAANAEYVRIMRWTDGGYDSWGFDYSFGRQMMPDGTLRNLWCWPSWHRAHWRAAPAGGARREGE